jgi:signal transduction histidine kinase/DNA-binding response OmpR family regulator
MATTETASILVVDDLPEKLMVFQAILEELGENVVTAQSGREALRYLLDQDFAVVLLDVNMPIMDGFETATLIRQRKRTQHTPIIFVTAFHDDVHTAKGYSLGAVDYILSPVVPEILRTKVRVFVDLFKMTERVKRQAQEHVTLAHEQAARAMAEQTMRRSTFLAEASKVLTSSLDYDANVRDVSRVAVPFLGDLSALTLVDEFGHLGKTELAWFDPIDGTRLCTIADEQGIQGQLLATLKQVLATETTEFLPQIPPTSLAPQAWKASRCDEEPTPPAPDFALNSAIILPLVARGRTLGALSLALGPSGRRYDPADLAVAEELASRAAIALDNARLYRDVQEADRRKNEFLAMLAHELRNPLAPIRNAVQILRLRGPEKSELGDVRDMIERQVQHLVRLVDDLLDVSRITRGKIRLQTEPVEVAVVVARAVETSHPLLDARRHQLTVSVPAESLRVEADPVRLAQVLANLLNNAAKYTEEGGRIWLAVEREGKEVLLRVRDTGIGIPPHMLASVFDLFTQVDRSLDRSQGGLGIGLTLVHRLVEMHAGSVQAFSAGANLGSEFVVRLPLLPDECFERASGNGVTEALVQGARHRILVVDDNADAAESLALLLQIAGHEVQSCHDGPAALAAAQAFQPDIILLDIGLPGMDGHEVARRLRAQKEFEKVLLVALTGYGQDEDQRRSREAGFDHHLVKPVEPEALFALFPSRRGPISPKCQRGTTASLAGASG